jgi:hypothetical protein
MKALSSVILLVVLPLAAAPRVDAAGGSGTTAYIEGVQALRGGNFRAAVDALNRAVQAEDSNPDYLRARGVANTLAESFPAAIADLERVMRLSNGADREAKLWLATAYRMSGDVAKGAQNFSMGGSVPNDYANMVYNLMGMEYWQSSTKGSYWDASQRRNVQVSAPVKRLFPDAAREYADRHEATGAAASAVVTERTAADLQRGDFASALHGVQMLRRTKPEDPTLRGKYAQALLGAGDGLHAREEFTRVLCVEPLWTDGYLGRAQAAALIGDMRRANADLDSATSLGANASSAKTRVTQLMGQAAPDSGPDPLAALARSDADIGAQANAALAALRRSNNTRDRYDEMYQDRIRVLAQAVRDDARNPDRPESLARFLFSNRAVPTVWNGPRATEALRPQSKTEEQAEIARALSLTEAALKLDARWANAMATRGLILYAIGRRQESEQMADRGLEIEPQNLRLLRLKAQLLIDTAAELRARAAGLRSPRVESHDEQRSDGVYRVTTTYPPTAEALAEARVLDARAAEVEEAARKGSAAAKRVDGEVIPALLKRADDGLARGDVSGAGRALQEAYRYHPDRPELVSRLAELAKRQGDGRGLAIFSLLAKPLRGTTAAPELKTAWEAIVRTDWPAAEAALGQASQRDAVDARIFAYRAVVAQHRARDAAAARRDRRIALALEEGRARLMGTSFLGEPRQPVDTIDLQETSLQTAVRLSAGDAELAARGAESALDMFGTVVALDRRFDKDLLILPMPTALLPDPTAEPNTIPEPPTLASLIALARLGKAQALSALGRPGDAQREYASVRASLANWPATSPKPNQMLLAASKARLGQAEAAYAARNYDEAFRLLTFDGWPALPDDMKARIKKLEDDVIAARQRR